MSTTAASTGDEHWEETINLPTGCKVLVDESRSLVELPIPNIHGCCGQTATVEADSSDDVAKRRQWKAISSAIWKGGLRSFDPQSGSDETKENSTIENKDEPIRVFNYKVPSTYDGLNPEPKALLQNAIQEEFTTSDDEITNGHQEDTTVAIMTAASMKSLRTATRSGGGIVVDAIVTAGISNARAAGASADFFGILPEEAKNSDDKDKKEKSDNPQTDPSPQPIPSSSEETNSNLRQRQKPPPGTINTVIVINGASLTQAAMIEAYAIAVEAKCGACVDHSVTCAKNAQRLSQGTGTDCAVLLCPSQESPLSVSYAGKHCLLAELIGQAVREATSEAILSNLHHLYGKSLWKYHAYRYFSTARGILKGARPCVPPRPMDPVPSAPLSVVVLGWALVGVAYSLYHNIGILPRSAAVLLAAAAWDRCLAEPPLSVHPVVLAGTTISLATKQWIPETAFAMDKPFLGFFAGLAFLIGTVSLFVSGAHVFVFCCRWAEDAVLGARNFFLNEILAFCFWVLEVVLFKTTFSLQLLCTIALQMAGFLERSQLQEARAQLSWLCSRDPTHLNSEELAGGTLESLSENLSDGTVAPWFWYILFGPVGALGYRVANTLDSRIGYRGGRYEWFGKASARFDDLINLIPARLTAVVLCVAAQKVPGCDHALGLATAQTDRHQCSSPNAGWPMGAMAGILGVKLEKKGQYCLGKDIPNATGPKPWDIRKGHKVVQLAGGITLVSAMVVCSVGEWLTSN